MTYAALPCALKLLAGVIVLIAPLPDTVLRDPTPEATALP